MGNIFSKENLMLIGMGLVTMYIVNNTMLKQYIKPNA